VGVGDVALFLFLHRMYVFLCLCVPVVNSVYACGAD